MEAIEVLQPGAFTTVQDLGRFGYQKYGVSVCGAMDQFALRIGNALVGNEDEAAALEATVLGPRLKALNDLKVAFTGADLSPDVNGAGVPMWRTLEVREGEVVSFGAPKSGCRAYLAIGGGIDFPLVMGSRSIHTRSNLGGKGRTLAKGDRLSVREGEGRKAGHPFCCQVPAAQIPKYGRDWAMDVILGPQNDYFTRRGIETFLSSVYEITPQADRMGYRLKGPRVEHKAGADILTDATPPGSIQVPGDGMPIILLADGQTTGGYSKIAVVTSVSQDLLAQARPGDRARFRRVTVLEAHRLMEEREAKIQKIKRGFIPL